jgi:hypothetical protein
MSDSDEVVGLTVVSTEWEAELVCTRLREAGIRCFHRITNYGFGSNEIATSGGPREVMVLAASLTEARKILAET